MKRTFFSIALVVITACSGTGPATAPPPDATTPTLPGTADTAGDTNVVIPSTPPPPTPPRSAGTTTAVANTTTTSSTVTTAAATTVSTEIAQPGTYSAAKLIIHLVFRSEVTDVTTAEFESAALAILNAPTGWGQSGFTFVADDASSLTVILAEGSRVDELCLPLETFGRVNCQNGTVVALNADRWREGGSDWDSTVDAYRVYVVNHEVGHLIGLRHPQRRCRSGEPVSAVMEPQTNNLVSCAGNGIPLSWEIDWASNRPVVVAPTPDWDDPRPQWPAG